MPNISATVYPKDDKKITGNFYPLYPSQNKELLEGEGIPFSELVIVKGAEKYLLYGFTDFRKPNFKVRGNISKGIEDTYESGNNIPVCLQIRHTTGKTFDFNTKQQKEEDPSDLEKHLCKLIEEKQLASDPEFLHGDNLKIWACKLVMDGTDPKLIENSGFEYLEKAEKQELPDLPSPESISQTPGTNNNGNGKSFNGNGKSSYVPPQSEYEKGKDRLKLLFENLPAHWKITSLSDLAIRRSAELHRANKELNDAPTSDDRVRFEEVESQIAEGTIKLFKEVYGIMDNNK